MANKQDPKELAQSIGLQDIDTEKAIDDIYHDMLLATYRHEPRNDWDRELNERIRRAYKESFKQEWVADTDKVLSTLLLGSPGQGKTTAFKEAGKKTAAALGLKFVLNPADDVFSNKQSLKSALEDVSDVDNISKAGKQLIRKAISSNDTETYREALETIASSEKLPVIVKETVTMALATNSKKDLQGSFLFITQEMSAENSKSEIGGLPGKEEEDGIVYMTKIINKRLALCKNAGASCLLLDDFPNASPNVQNVGLALTDEKRFQGLNLQNVYIGLTGNLGSLDGTHTTKLSTALRGRCKTFYTQDKLANFIVRGQQKYRDDIGDAGVLGFLNRLPQFFANMPNTKHQGGFESPRTWDHVILDSRRAIRKRGNGSAAMSDIKDIANSLIGLEAGQAFYSYYFSLMQNADPLARECIQTGNLNEKQLKQRFSEGFSHNEQHFAYQFAIALSDYAVRRIAQDKNKMEETVSRFAEGTLALSPDTIPFAIDNFKMKLANQVDELAEKGDKNNRKLLYPVKEKIVQIFNANKNCTKDHIELLIEAITDADKFDMGSRRRNRGR